MGLNSIRRQLLLPPELETRLLRYQERLAKAHKPCRVTWQDCARAAIEMGLDRLDVPPSGDSQR